MVSSLHYMCYSLENTFAEWILYDWPSFVLIHCLHNLLDNFACSNPGYAGTREVPAIQVIDAHTRSSQRLACNSEHQTDCNEKHDWQADKF